jgi:hypothetical protein
VEGPACQANIAICQHAKEPVMGIRINTSVDINARKEEVWNVLTNFAAYGDWCPTMRIQGAADAGTKLSVRLSADGERGMTFKPRVLAARPGEELRWLGRLGIGGLVDGEHYFILSSNRDGTTRLEHGEDYSGLLVALMKRTLDKKPDPGAAYQAFNLALKQRVETRRTTPASPGGAR